MSDVSEADLMWRTTVSRRLQARKSHQGRGAGTRKHEERERLSREERGRASESWQTKLQKWVDGDQVGGNRKI